MTVSGRASGAQGVGTSSLNRLCSLDKAHSKTRHTSALLFVIVNIHSEHDHLLIVYINARHQARYLRCPQQRATPWHNILCREPHLSRHL